MYSLNCVSEFSKFDQPYIVWNDFVKISKNLIRYKSENNFIGSK